MDQIDSLLVQYLSQLMDLQERCRAFLTSIQLDMFASGHFDRLDQPTTRRDDQAAMPAVKQRVVDLNRPRFDTPLPPA